MEGSDSDSQQKLIGLLGPKSTVGKELCAEFKPEVVFAAIVIAYTAYCFADEDAYQIDCDVVSGKFFQTFGISNFPGNLLKKSLSLEIQRAFWVILAALVKFRHPKFSELEPFGKIYQLLFDSQTRTKTGEFFTPENLVDNVMSKLELGSGRICDPACGPGIFLVKAIRRLLDVNPSIELGEILVRVHGIDINPLLVLAARANYLLQIRKKLPVDRTIQIPVRRIDALLARQCPQYEVIIGNPPWIGWEKLPKSARKLYQKLWDLYDLGEQVTSPGIGKVRKEFSALFTTAVIDRYLCPGGELGFLITRTILKNAASSGFRRLMLPSRDQFSITSLEQLTEEQPFPEVKSKFMLLVVKKSAPVTFPIAYNFGNEKLQVYPQTDLDWSQPWLVLTSAPELRIYRSLAKQSEYRAHLGCNNGGLAGCYWVDVIDESDNLVKVRNFSHAGKIEVPEVTAWIERELIYTLIKSSTKPKKLLLRDLFIIIPHTPGHIQRPLNREELESQYPHTMEYFSKFEHLLRQRSGYKTILNNSDEYWAIYNLGEYSNSPWKVCWSVFGSKLNARVIPERYQPIHTVAYISLDNKLEAYFLMGLLNSSLFSFAMAASSFPSTKSFGTPSVVDRLGLPKFNSKQNLHKNIARLAVDYQGTVGFNAEKPNCEELEWIKHRIDTLVAELFGLDSSDIDLCQHAYSILHRL